MITQEALSPVARALVAEAELVAPELLLAETSNLLWKKHRRGLIDAAEAADALAATRAMMSRLVPLAELAPAALALALRRDHPAYDAFYVVLAQREGLPFVTADARLATAFAADAEIRLLAA